MRHGSVFSGIGGFDLAAQWMGWENVFHCEIEPYLRELLKERWKQSVSYGDIKTVDFRVWRGRFDILTGGDPCQPNSNAGLRKGTEDSRYLWPQMLRAIQESRPAWIVNENVDGSISNGILDIKIDDLESEGYSCQAFSIPAEAVGALHKRERIWLIAHDPNSNAEGRAPGRFSEKEKGEWLPERDSLQQPWEPVDLWPFDSYPDTKRLQEQYDASKSKVFAQGVSRYFGFGTAPHGHISCDIIESGIIRSLNGLPEGMDYAYRNKRIAALGNAVLPQIPYEIFKAIEQYELNQT